MENLDEKCGRAKLYLPIRPFFRRFFDGLGLGYSENVDNTQADENPGLSPLSCMIMSFANRHLQMSSKA
jgi:hypothetical protein